MIERERPRPFGDSWKFEPREKLSYYQRALMDRGVLFPSSREVDLPRPKGKVAVYPVWQQLLWLLPRAMMPILVRGLFMRFTGWTIHPAAMYVLLLAYNLTVLRAFYRLLRTLVLQHGYLDGEVERDSATPEACKRILIELRQGMTMRPLMVMALSYDRNVMLDLSLWLPVQLCIFTVLADFFYYWVHRATHETDFLWNFHRRHHTTKHPTAYLLGFADEPQELFDLLASPVLAYMLYPLSFDALYIWALCFNMIEIMGHSGLRLYYPTVLTGAFLRPFLCELVIEDHDLHHRFGWRDSCNYGKQTLFWDRLFGTSGQRIETNCGNVDWSRRAI